jgi:hypothetical protein
MTQPLHSWYRIWLRHKNWRHTNKGIRLVEFSPFGRLFILASFNYQCTEVVQTFGLLFSTVKLCIDVLLMDYINENGLGHILDDFFTYMLIWSPCKPTRSRDLPFFVRSRVKLISRLFKTSVKLISRSFKMFVLYQGLEIPPIYFLDLA